MFHHHYCYAMAVAVKFHHHFHYAFVAKSLLFFHIYQERAVSDLRVRVGELEAQLQ